MTFSPKGDRRTILLVLVSGVILLVVLSVSAWQQRGAQEKERDLFRNTRDTIEHVHRIYSSLRDAESGQRGYVLTGDPQYLAPYHVAVDQLPSFLDDLAERFAALPEARVQVEEIRRLARQKMSELNETLQADKTDHQKALELVRAHRNLATMAELHTALNGLRDEQYRALHATDRRERDTTARASLLFLLGSALTLVLLGAATLLVWRDRRVEAQAQQLVAQAKLVDLAPVMTRTEDGIILSWSKGYEQISGWTGVEAVGRQYQDLLHPQSATSWETIRQELTTQGQWSGELSHIRRDGTPVETTHRLTMVYDPLRGADVVVDVATDISALKAAEKALVASERRFRLLADNMSQFAWTTDANGAVTWFNRRWHDYTGLSVEEAGGWRWRTLLHPDQAQRVVDALSRCIVQGSVWEDTFQLRGRDGNYRWFLSRAVPVDDAQGASAQWFGTNTDITELREAEQAQARLAVIVQSSSDAIFSKSVDGRVLTWNHGAQRLFGYTEQEIVGQPIDLLIPTPLLEQERALRLRALAGESGLEVDTQRRHKDGTLLDVALALAPIRNRAGEIIAVSQTLRDIGERLRAECALQASAEEFRTLVSAIPQQVWVCEPDGRCIYLSQQWLTYTGTTLEENLGYQWLSLVHADDMPTTQRVWEEAVKLGATYNTEYRLRAADGSYRWFLARGVPMKDAWGSIVKWFGTTTDISDQKDSAMALERVNALLQSRSDALADANKELEAFSYSVSHDLRAPLRTMTGFAQALLEDYEASLEPEAVRYLRTISKGARQMGQLIDDLLAFSRLSRQRLERTPVPLNELVDVVRADLEGEIGTRTIEWHIAALPTCLVDRVTMRQVLANLLGNAIKYTRPRPVARIEVGWIPDEHQPSFCRLFVRDNGVGFDMQYADKLFAVFQRLHRAEDFEGTGVGLAIVQRIVHRHGGRIWAESLVDQGSTFWWTLERAS